MPTIDDTTQNLGLPLPHANNELSDDVLRLRDTIAQVDAYLAGLLVGASQAEMVTGTEPGIRAMSPLRVSQAIAALSKRLQWSDRAVAYTAAVWQGVMANTSGGAWTLTLPAAPAVGDTIGVIDAAGTFGTATLTIGRNGLKIMGLAENMTCSTSGLAFELVYQGTAYGWRIF